MKTVTSIKHVIIKKDVARGKAWVNTGVIHVDKRLKGKEQLYVILHEILHCQNPKFSEAKIIGHSTELADLLWQENYRKVDI